MLSDFQDKEVDPLPIAASELLCSCNLNYLMRNVTHLSVRQSLLSSSSSKIHFLQKRKTSFR